MRKNVFWFMMIMLLVFTSLHSGCGGSDGGSVGNENGKQNQQETPNEPTTPDNPNTPTTPDNPNTPTMPDNPDTPQGVAYSFSVLTGTWTPSNGSGTASGGGVNATMTLKGGQVSFTNATSGGNVEVSSNIYWDAVQNGSVLVSDVRDNFGGSGSRTFTNMGGNTWRLSGTDSDGAYSTTVTITSETTATVERDGYYSGDGFAGVHFSMTYTITKQDSPSTPDTPTTGSLNGTWRITGGTLSGSGISANYVNSSAETFTLALSDAGDGDYVLSVSGEGVSKKESTPYVKAYFEGIDDEVRVVWGTSTGVRDGLSTCVLSGPNTYSLSYQFSIHDVNTASYQLVNASTIRYTQSGPSIHDGNDAVVDVALTLERVN